jgi:hypothetical protein
LNKGTLTTCGDVYGSRARPFVGVADDTARTGDYAIREGKIPLGTSCE